MRCDECGADDGVFRAGQCVQPVSYTHLDVYKRQALEDHVCDEWRYFCMSRPVRPIRGGQTAAIWSDPLDQLR